MEWISVEDRLPKNGEQVLSLVQGHFPSDNDPLCQRYSLRVFQSTFYRYSGWNTPFCPSNCWVKWWMPLPESPKESEEKNDEKSCS